MLHLARQSLETITEPAGHSGHYRFLKNVKNCQRRAYWRRCEEI